MYKLTLLLLFPLLLFNACQSNVEDDGPVLPSFDRKAMLTNWADNVILPAYTGLQQDLATLKSAMDVYLDEPSANGGNAAAVRDAFLNSYLKWQQLSPFILGKAEEIRLREQLNTYPADVELILENALAGNANLALPSNIAAQGFPALDYLLFGGADRTPLTDDDAELRNYAAALVDRMIDLSTVAHDDWTNGYREVFIQNDGNSATASIDRTVNDYIFHFEKYLRAGKVGIPAGVFSDTPLPDRAEARYAGRSKDLYLASLAASRTFFADEGLTEYLDALNVVRDGELLSTKINDQFVAIGVAAQSVGPDFEEQVETDNSKMLGLYDEMQRLVVLLKVDMLQALSINVDYVDADGD